jgi:hypothetical protein
VLQSNLTLVQLSGRAGRLPGPTHHGSTLITTTGAALATKMSDLHGRKSDGDYSPDALLHDAVGVGRNLIGPRKSLEFLALPIIEGLQHFREGGDDGRYVQSVPATPIYVAHAD